VKVVVKLLDRYYSERVMQQNAYFGKAKDHQSENRRKMADALGAGLNKDID
jgi:hypothetical protein